MTVFSFRKERNVYEDSGSKLCIHEKAETDEIHEGPSPRLQKQEVSAGGGDCDQPRCQEETVRPTKLPASSSENSKVAALES